MLQYYSKYVPIVISTRSMWFLWCIHECKDWCIIRIDSTLDHWFSNGSLFWCIDPDRSKGESLILRIDASWFKFLTWYESCIDSLQPGWILHRFSHLGMNPASILPARYESCIDSPSSVWIMHRCIEISLMHRRIDSIRESIRKLSVKGLMLF